MLADQLAEPVVEEHRLPLEAEQLSRRAEEVRGQAAGVDGLVALTCGAAP